jgi:RNA polymerase sigma factor (sigma-70 family)
VGVTAGDSGFDAMVAEHHAEIYRYLLRMTGRTPVADDLSQETFLRAYRTYRSLPAEANARTRLFSIATNLSRTRLRGQRRRQLAGGALTATAVGADGQALDCVRTGGGVTAVIEAVVTILPFRQRAAFLQRKVHMLDYAAIGQSLQCSIESAQALVVHALQRIRQALDGQDGRGSRDIYSNRVRRPRPGDGPRGAAVRGSGEPMRHGDSGEAGLTATRRLSQAHRLAW